MEVSEVRKWLCSATAVDRRSLKAEARRGEINIGSSSPDV